MQTLASAVYEQFGNNINKAGSVEFHASLWVFTKHHESRKLWTLEFFSLANLPLPATDIAVIMRVIYRVGTLIYFTWKLHIS